jgi:peptide-methionine (S)-S-oxide reductase
MKAMSARTVFVGLLAGAVLAGALYVLTPALARAGAGDGTAVPPLNASVTADDDLGQAVLAGGCFWGMETVFQHVNGVRKVFSGYAGGAKSTANYQATSTGRTEHAESVHIFYDPDEVSYAELLRIYFSVAHDPTQVDRQGPDTGHEYRSEIFALNATQRRIARAYITQLDGAGVFSKPIATTVSVIRPDEFYRAEDYHQNYAERHPNSLYIQFNDVPKVHALAREFPGYYRDSPALSGD